MFYLCDDPQSCNCHCKECGEPTVHLDYGGCGGNGQVIGCESCDSVFMQITGGISATLGGETWEKLPVTLSERKGRK